MADQDSLSTDSDDEEYVPPEREVYSSSGDELRDVKELNNDTGRRKRRKPMQDPSRRKKGGKMSTEQQFDSGTDESPSEGGEEEEREEKKKARLDELWTGFKNNTSIPIKPPTRQDSRKEDKNDACGDTVESKTVIIKKTYDFAGEDVIVEEKVKANSQEALDYNKTQPQTSPLLKTHPQASSLNNPPITSARNKLGATALLQSLNKKPKISTLEKSRLDWSKFKMTEGIQEELEFHKKDGYLQKKEFLQRTDARQFEQEREERLKRFKSLY